MCWLVICVYQDLTHRTDGQTIRDFGSIRRPKLQNILEANVVVVIFVFFFSNRGNHFITCYKIRNRVRLDDSLSKFLLLMILGRCCLLSQSFTVMLTYLLTPFFVVEYFPF